LYNPEHPSNALNVTGSIIDHFVSTAEVRKKTPIIMFLPGAREIDSYLRTGKWVYGNLYQRCLVSGYNCFDGGAAMLRELGVARVRAEGICEYFCFGSFTLHGHYNEKGNKLLSEVFLKYIEKYLADLDRERS
jgi:hypothetical protein